MIKDTLKDGRKRFSKFQELNWPFQWHKITDYNGEEIQGSFYEQELQNTAEGTFQIEKVLKRQGDKSLVKWMGYPKSFNSWIDTKTILKLTTEKSF